MIKFIVDGFLLLACMLLGIIVALFVLASAVATHVG